MRLVLRERAPLDPERLFPRARIEDAAVERAVLGAILRGSLALRDVADLPDEVFACDHQARIFVVVSWLLSHRDRWPARYARTSRGIPVELAIRACAVAGVPQPYGGVLVDGDRRVCVGYIAGLAREAPARAAALRALQRVRELMADRWDEEEARERMIDAFQAWAADAARFFAERERARRDEAALEPLCVVRERRGEGPEGAEAAADGRAARKIAEAMV